MTSTTTHHHWTIPVIQVYPTMFGFCLHFVFLQHTHLVRHHYRPPTKLREYNVFSRVCLSVRWGGSPVTDPWCIGLHCSGLPRHGTLVYMPPIPSPPRTWDLTVQEPPANDIWWPSLGPVQPFSLQDTSLPTVADIKHGLCTWAVRILLEYFL